MAPRPARSDGRVAEQSAPPAVTVSPSFPPADALLTLPWRRWASVVRLVLLAVCAAIVATWIHHRIGSRLRTVAAILAAFLAIVAAWAWETGRPAAIQWVRETAWPAVRRWAADAAVVCRGILTPPLTV